jgi:hypothetical protein
VAQQRIANYCRLLGSVTLEMTELGKVYAAVIVDT